MQPIRTVAAVIVNNKGEVLLVRKRASSIFIQPGGKPEPGESPVQTLARELEEELGVALDLASVVALGEFTAMAVNEPGRQVQAQAFRCVVSGTPAARAEIEELAWVAPEAPFRIPVAPLSREHILPAYRASLR